MKKQKKISTIIYNFNFLFKVLIIFFALNYNSQGFSQIIEQNRIILSKNVIKKISTYLLAAKNHNYAFYSKSISKKLFYFNIMYVSISEKGDTVTMSYCDEDFSGCAQKYLAKFQTKKKCERISNQKCRIIVENENFITIDSKKIKILNINDHFIYNNKSIELKNYEIQYPTNNEFSDGQYDQ